MELPPKASSDLSTGAKFKKIAAISMAAILEIPNNTYYLMVLNSILFTCLYSGLLAPNTDKI